MPKNYLLVVYFQLKEKLLFVLGKYFVGGIYLFNYECLNGVWNQIDIYTFILTLITRNMLFIKFIYSFKENFIFT